MFHNARNVLKLCNKNVFRYNRLNEQTKATYSLQNSKIEYQKKILSDLSSRLNINKPEDWYKVTFKDIVQSGGAPLLRQYNRSTFRLLSTLYPEYELQPWKFKNVPRNFWQDKQNQQSYLEWLSEKLGIQKPSDWHKVRQKDFIDNNGSSLISFYGSLDNLFKSIVPEYEEHKDNEFFDEEYFSDMKNQRKFLKEIECNLGIETPKLWAKVPMKEIRKFGGKSLLTIYNNSMYQMLSSVFPEYNFQPWEFKLDSHNFLIDNINNQKEFIKVIGEKLNIKDPNDWYNVSVNDLRSQGASNLLSLYNDSPSKLITSLFPEYNLKLWLFQNVPKGFWRDPINQKEFILWLGENKGFKRPEDWYKITSQDINEFGGKEILKYYNYSFKQLLLSLFPEYNLQLWKFPTLPYRFWSDFVSNDAKQKEYIEFLAKNLNIQKAEDWYYVTRQQIEKIAGKFPKTVTLLELMRSVQLLYPTLRISVFKDIKYKKTQHWLKIALDKIFPTHEILEDYRHPDIIHHTGRSLELDIFIPSLNIAFEFQGSQHYHDIRFFNLKKNLVERQEMDKKKEDACKLNGITLIKIPYWWDLKSSSIEATIYRDRPELFNEQPLGDPIPVVHHSSTTLQRKKQTGKIKNQLLLCEDWDTDMDPTGWWMSEKYDGIRAYWTSYNLMARTGRQIRIPDKFRDGFPVMALDGELWTRRGLQQEASTLAKTSGESLWNRASYYIFDLPDLRLPFEERIKLMKELTLPSHIKIVDHIKCQGKEHMEEFYRNVMAMGGEGIMLREPGSYYESGRSHTLRRYKSFKDTEVQVVEVMPTGLKCEQLNGIHVHVNFVSNGDEQMYKIKCRKGTVVTVTYTGVNIYGKLLQPQFYRIRGDVTWKELREQFEKDNINKADK